MIITHRSTAATIVSVVAGRTGVEDGVVKDGQKVIGPAKLSTPSLLYTPQSSMQATNVVPPGEVNFWTETEPAKTSEP